MQAEQGVHEAAKVGGDIDPKKPQAPEAPAKTSGALAMVQQVRAQGWEAIEHIASIAKSNIAEWPSIAHWLHQNRGNDFASHVAKQMSGETPATKAGDAEAADKKEAAPEHKPTKFPVVLLHGLGAGPSSFDAAIPAAMKADGDAVFEITAPPYESPEERAKAIAPQLEDILKKTGASKLNLVAWSLGGLDARYLISSMGWGSRIASLSMVGTPNRGAATADKVMSLLPEAEGALSTLRGLLDKVATIADHTPKTIDPTIGAIDKALLKALNLARQLHLAPKAKDEKQEEGGQGPDVAKANKLAQEVGDLARKYQAKLPKTVVDGLNVLARKMGHDIGNSMADDSDVTAAIGALTEESATRFNQQNPDDARVYYQSWAGIANGDGTLGDKDAKNVGKLDNANGDPHKVGNIGNQTTLEVAQYLSRSSANGKLNDGVVPVESAQWGNYRGAVPADHNHLTRPDSKEEQDRTGFDVVAFYKKMAEDLANRGY